MKTRWLLIATLFSCALLLFSPMLFGYSSRSRAARPGETSAAELPGTGSERFICEDDEDENGDDETMDCLGDIIATCSSTLSRNRHVGEQLALGKSWTEIRESMDNVAEIMS